jgi:hypothetical protein
MGPPWPASTSGPLLMDTAKSFTLYLHISNSSTSGSRHKRVGHKVGLASLLLACSPRASLQALSNTQLGQASQFTP